MNEVKEQILKNISSDLEEFHQCCFDAFVQHQLGGVGGCKHFEAEAFPAKFRKYIVAYIETEKTLSECVVDYMLDNGYLVIKNEQA